MGETYAPLSHPYKRFKTITKQMNITCWSLKPCILFRNLQFSFVLSWFWAQRGFLKTYICKWFWGSTCNLPLFSDVFGLNKRISYCFCNDSGCQSAKKQYNVAKIRKYEYYIRGVANTSKLIIFPWEFDNFQKANISQGIIGETYANTPSMYFIPEPSKTTQQQHTRTKKHIIRITTRS